MKALYTAAVLITLACALSLAQSTPESSVQRLLHGRTLVSNELPAADLTFGKEFGYVGAQVVNLYGNAEAEQHVFIKAGNGGPAVQAFYWVQFEHFLPTNKMTYDYKLSGTIDLGGLPFVYDVKSFPDYAAMQAEDPRSDGAAVASFLAYHNFTFPKRAARVRMFHLPTPDHRSELMIIYGEAVPENSPIPIHAEGLLLDTASPESAKTLLDHARASLTISKH